ncbi:MAG: nucleotidyltransferase domain-containing protein [Agitococcus sp.]|nr:nucleotidyltransferase domain-containing protein [Agitococcus sp.]
MSDVYPSISWVRQRLRNNMTSRVKDTVLACYIVGSEARGCARSDSDLDIAIVVASKPRLTALKMTEWYHAKFREENQKPMWKGRIVDFQFFYPNDEALAGYSKVTVFALPEAT